MVYLMQQILAEITLLLVEAMLHVPAFDLKDSDSNLGASNALLFKIPTLEHLGSNLAKAVKFEDITTL
jgi:hypothetical protein